MQNENGEVRKKKRTWTKSHESQSNRWDVHYWRPDAELAFLHVYFTRWNLIHAILISVNCRMPKENIIQIFRWQTGVVAFVRSFGVAWIYNENERSNNNQLIRTTMQMFCDCFCCFLFTSKNGFMVSMTTTRLFRFRKNENMPKQSTDASFFSRKCCASAIAWSLLSSPPNRLFCIFFYLLLIDLKMRSNRISTTFRARIMSNSLSELGPQTLQI